MRQAVGAIGDGHRHVGEHHAGIVGVPVDPAVSHGHRHGLGQPRAIRHLGQQSDAGVRHHALTVSGHPHGADGLTTMYLQEALLSWLMCASNTRILPGQEGFFTYLRPRIRWSRE